VTCNIVCHTIENTHSLLYCTVKVDNTREEINPDDLAKGVPFYMSSNAMSELMEFLAYYARLIHSNRYYRSVLLNNPGATFMDIITASDIAYAITLVKNNLHVWTQQHENAKNESDKDKDKDKDNEVSKKKVKTLKPLFTAGKGKKRTFGNSTWNVTKARNSSRKHWRLGSLPSTRTMCSTGVYAGIGIDGLKQRVGTCFLT